MRVIAYTGGRHVPSARFRIRQYIPSLSELGIEIREEFPRFGSYPPEKKWARPFWALGTLTERFPSVLDSYGGDLTLLQREMFSTLVTWEPLTKRPRVLDVDDAIWIFRGGSAARRLAALSDSVLCGNSFLAEHFSQWNPSVVVLPTAVDTNRFIPPAAPPDPERPVLGWSGGRAGLSQLYTIEKALAEVLRKHPLATLRVMCDAPPAFRAIPAAAVEYLPWSPETEVLGFQGMTVALMPLEDSTWNRGKCSYKMLLALSCGVPVVASPVGMNSEVLAQARCGLEASATDEWVTSLHHLLSCPQEALQMGQTGRALVLEQYSISAIAPRLARELRRIAGKSSPAQASPRDR